MEAVAKKFIPANVSQCSNSEPNIVSSCVSDLPSRQAQLKKEPKIPSSILPPTISKQMTVNDANKIEAGENQDRWYREIMDQGSHNENRESGVHSL